MLDGPTQVAPHDAPLPPRVVYAERHDTSPTLRQLALARSSTYTAQAPAAILRVIPRAFITPTDAGLDPVVQPILGPGVAPSSALSFDGVPALNGLVPPDPTGDVGPEHYVQMVNVSFAVFTKTTGALAFGPVDNNTLWAGFGGPCETTNDGDPIVLHDQQADRWLLSQFANIQTAGPYYECVALSATSDPTGAYHRYAFKISDTKINDYPKFGVWPDGYYLSVNQFIGVTWAGAGLAALERDRMLAGQPARMVFFDLYDVNSNYGGMLPSDWDGNTPPPAGAPNYFVEVDDDAWWTPADQLRVWEFHVDWTTPASSTVGITGDPNAVLDTAVFDSNLCNYARSCVAQPGTSARLDAISDRLMQRLAYRNFGDHQALVVNHTVDVTGADRAGIRWYELRSAAGSWSIHQQGTFSPDTANRWVGSMAMDASGNIALGYSVSSASVYPSIRYTGRLAADPPGVMTLGESSIIEGSGAQTTFSGRWGDYSAMNVDPADDCTFWYTNQYYASTQFASWRTRIGAFRLLDCGSATLSGTVTDALTAQPISNALVVAGNNSLSFQVMTGIDGTYRVTADAGAYTVTAAAYGYAPAQAGPVTLTATIPVTLNLALTPAARVVVSGFVTDGPTGEPVAARLNVVGFPFDPPITQTVALSGTGYYSFSLAGAQAYTLTVSSYFRPTQTRAIGPLLADQTENFALGRQVRLILVYRQ